MGSGTSSLAGAILVDDRERALIKVLAGIPAARGRAFATRLALGDAVVPRCGVVAERKTAADLAASLKDGRWREQVARLRSAAGYSACVVVEGLAWSPGGADRREINGVKASALRSCLLGCALRDGVPVFSTSGVEETAALLLQIGDKRGGAFRRGSANDASDANDAPPPPLAAKPKIACGRDLAVAQLALVPGVSQALARALLGGRETISALIASDEYTLERLSEVRHGASNRRVGNKLAFRILALMPKNSA